MFSVIILDFDEFLNKKKTIKYEVYLCYFAQTWAASSYL